MDRHKSIGTTEDTRTGMGRQPQGRKVAACRSRWKQAEWMDGDGGKILGWRRDGEKGMEGERLGWGAADVSAAERKGCMCWSSRLCCSEKHKCPQVLFTDPAPGTHTGFLSLNAPTHASQAIPGENQLKLLKRVETLYFLLTFLG